VSKDVYTGKSNRPVQVCGCTTVEVCYRLQEQSMVVEWFNVVLERTDHVHHVLSRMNSTLKPTVHRPPEPSNMTSTHSVQTILHRRTRPNTHIKPQRSKHHCCYITMCQPPPQQTTQTPLSKEYAGKRWRGGATGKAFGLAINNAKYAFQGVGR